MVRKRSLSNSKEDGKMKHTLKIFAILNLMLVAASHVWGQSALRIRTGSITNGCSLEYYSDQNCTTPVDASNVAAGSNTYIKAIPDESHALSGITITVEPTVRSNVAKVRRRVASNGVDLGDYIEVTAIGNGIYRFLMPADENMNVRVSATFPEKGVITPVVSISGWTYGDTAHQPTVSGNTGNGTVTYTYSDAQNGTYTETVPTEAGTYWVKADVAMSADYYAGVSEPVSFVIAQKAVNVTITGHHAMVEWDGEEHSVSGYDFSADTPLYTEAFFTFSGTAVATRTDYGTTTMGLDASQFENTNDNFTVTFHVTDGWLTISTLVTFDANGHGTAPDNQYVFLGDYATAPTAPSVNGYTFGGWYTTAECTGDAYDFANTPVNGSLTLYAKWVLNVYTISYNLNGGSADNPTTYTVESEAITLVNPTLESCIFLGWTGTGLNAATTTVTIPTGSTGDREYTATWTGPQLVLSNNGDNSSAINAAVASGKNYDVTLTGRTIYKDGDWNTLVLPFNLATLTGTPLEGLTVKTLEGSTYSDGTLTMNFSDATSIEAGKPYIVKDNADLVIRTAADWSTFANNVGNYQNKTVKLATDLNVSSMVGGTFDGTLDGCGHTITLSLSSGSTEQIALFNTLGNATIKNLKIAGTITFGKHRPASIASYISGTTTIKNCWSSVSITSNYNPSSADWVDGGAFVARVNSGTTLNMSDCLFTGSITYKSKNNQGGGMVGWTQGSNSRANLTHCLFAPSSMTMTATDPKNKTYVFVSGEARGNLVECYYNSVANDVNSSVLKKEGSYTTATDSDLLALLGSGWEIRDGQVVPKMNPDIVNPVFKDVLISDATVNVSTTYADFIGSYAPITDDGLLLDTHNPNGDAMHAALSITLSEPTRDGYTFSNWCTDAGLTTPLSSTIPFATNGNVTLYSKWTPHTYTVRFNKNHDDASGTMADQPFTYGTEQALNANAFTAPTGYMFVGWSTTTDGEVEYTDGQSVSNLTTEQDAVVNLFAIWGYAYTISYNLAGGSADNPTHYSELSDAITLVNPTRTGYTFMGWTGTDLDEPTMSVTIPAGSSGNRSYTATWTPIAYSITYNLGGGTLPEGESNPTSYNIESADITLVNPIREDYTFLGWTGSNGNVPQTSVTIATGSTGDREYTANWIQYSTDTYLAYNTTTQEFETLMVPVYTTVTSGTTTMSNGWYAVKENVTISSRIKVTGTVNLVLFDGATLTVPLGLNVPQGVTLNIFGQTNGTGVLTATVGEYEDGAAIGGNENQAGGMVTIHGGTVTATVCDYGSGAGIGGGYKGNGGTVTIYGGTVTATGGKDGDGAGIGGGEYGSGGTVTIHGGTVTATVSEYGYGAGIGGGYKGNGGTVTLGDMRVYASAKATTPVASGNRVSTCRSKYAKLERCTDHNGKNGYCTYCDAHVILANNDAEAAAGEKNTDVISTWNATTTDIILQGRTLYKDGDWNTLCLPFNIGDPEAEEGHHFDGTLLEGATVMTLASTDFEDGTLTMNFADATSIEAGKPYLVKWTTAGDDLVNPVFTGVTVSDASNNAETDYVDFIGNFSSLTLAGGDKSVLYLGKGNQLYYPTANRTMNACRAYFQLKGLTVADISHEVKMYFGDEEDDADSLISLTPDPSPGRGEKWYDLNGRQLPGKPSQKGIYINNGRKVVIK